MSAASALLVGESWQTIEFHVKGFDLFSNSTYTEAIGLLRDALTENGIQTEYQPSHVAATDFPETAEELTEYDVVVLSDIGYNTLALPPATFKESIRRPDRLQLLEDYVRAGGGLLMVGGYLSFQGFEGKGGFRGTPVESALPVSLEQFDDRVERSDGVTPDVLDPDHDIVSDLDTDWPDVLGYNRVHVDDGATELVSVGEDPLLVIGEYGDGRTAAFTSDCAPHWCPPEFTDWEGYPALWSNLVEWIAGT